MPGFILPPPIGQGNALYEAYPQGPGTPGFSLGSDSIIPGNTINTPGVTTNANGGATNTGIAGTTISTPGGSANPPRITVTPNPGQGGSSQAIVSGSLADYFARAIIIVLGFIFIAVGLNMLRPGTVPMPARLKP